MKQLGPYAIEAELGRGGMGVVYRARDTRDGRVVALKVLRGLVADLELLARFQREATALRDVAHPNLVRVLDLELAPPQPYVAFELVPGETLRARVERDGPLPLDEALRISSEVASGLSAVHERNLLHRDVKPENVLLGPAGAKLADFGLVKDLDRQSLTQTGAVLGTPGYMAPEQAEGDKTRWGATTDVYGLAATLHFALTGRPPFQGVTVIETLQQVLHAPPPSPRASRADVPAWLDAVCRRGMAKRNDERFPSAVAFRLALREGSVPRSRRGPLLAAALSAAAVGVAGLAVWQGSRAQGTTPTEAAAVASRSVAGSPPSVEAPPIVGPVAQRPQPMETAPQQLEESADGVGRAALFATIRLSARSLREPEDTAKLLELANQGVRSARGPAEQAQVWDAVVEAFAALDTEFGRWAQFDGNALHAWLTERLEDPGFEVDRERILRCLRLLDGRRAEQLEATRLGPWVAQAQGLVLSDPEAEVNDLVLVARLCVLQQPADAELTREVLRRLRARELTPEQRREVTVLEELGTFLSNGSPR